MYKTALRAGAGGGGGAGGGHDAGEVQLRNEAALRNINVEMFSVYMFVSWLDMIWTWLRCRLFCVVACVDS